jgi:hypothetical protein
VLKGYKKGKGTIKIFVSAALIAGISIFPGAMAQQLSNQPSEVVVAAEASNSSPLNAQSIYTAISNAREIRISGQIDRIRTRLYATSDSTPVTLSGGAHYRRMSFEALGGYPSQSYFRSADRFMPDGAVDGTNGGYWVIDESEIEVDMLGALGDGSTDDTTAIQAALNLAVFTRAKVIIRAKVYIISSIVVPVGVTVDGNGAGRLTQKAAANSYAVVSLMDRAHLLGVAVDANELSNPKTVVAVHVANNNDTVVRDCLIENSAGSGVVINNGERATIINNVIRNFHDHGVVTYGSNGKKEHIIRGNWFNKIGWAAVVVQQADNVTVQDNHATGQLIGGRDGRMRVNVNGDQVTWVSGPRFTGNANDNNVRSGNFFVFDGGREIRVKSVESATRLTIVEPVAVNMANVLASLGSGDLYAIIGSSYFDVVENLSERTATFGMGASLSQANIYSGRGRIRNNSIKNSGKNAINIAADGDTLSGGVEDIGLLDNYIDNAGYAGGIGEMDHDAIFLSDVPGVGKRMKRIRIEGNIVTSYAGEGQTRFWLGTDGELFNGAFAIGVENRIINVQNGNEVRNGLISNLPPPVIAP